MAQFKPIKCTEAQMNSKAKSEGQLFFCTDTNKIYLDETSSLREEYCKASSNENNSNANGLIRQIVYEKTNLRIYTLQGGSSTKFYNFDTPFTVTENNSYLLYVRLEISTHYSPLSFGSLHLSSIIPLQYPNKYYYQDFVAYAYLPIYDSEYNATGYHTVPFTVQFYISGTANDTEKTLTYTKFSIKTPVYIDPNLYGENSGVYINKMSIFLIKN